MITYPGKEVIYEKIKTKPVKTIKEMKKICKCFTLVMVARNVNRNKIFVAFINTCISLLFRTCWIFKLKRNIKKNGLSMTCDMSVVLKMVLNTITLTLKKNGEKRGHFNPLKKKCCQIYTHCYKGKTWQSPVAQ
jgi:hypothetical protein